MATPRRSGPTIHRYAALWTRRFHADPHIIGKTINLALWGSADTLWTVVGIAAPEFKGLSAPWAPTQVWMSFAQGSDRPIARIGFAPIVRLKPGVTMPQAQAELNTIVSSMKKKYPDNYDSGDSFGATLYSLGEPAPPQGASAARTVLIARGDSICSLSGSPATCRVAQWSPFGMTLKTASPPAAIDTEIVST